MENSNWIFQLLGRLHPLLVHFPIGLLVVALCFELFTLRGKRPGLRQGINWMVFFGAASACVAALFGWLLRTQENYSGDLVDNHQYAGIATAVFALATALVLRNTLKKQSADLRAYRFMLFATVIATTIAGHLGANLTHGEDYLWEILPNHKTVNNGATSSVLLTELGTTDSLSALQQDKLSLEVRGLFAHKCYQCHSENKQKGALILATKEGVFKGGESGLAIVPGKPEQSELFRRITLPANHKEVMPTKGKLLNDREIALVKLWIQKGAHWSDEKVKIFPEALLALQKIKLPISNQAHPVDKLVDDYFQKHNIEWPVIVDDPTFIRRAYLDIIGLLPEPEAIHQFENDKNPNKRDALIDSLLGDHRNYTQHWLSFWNDLLRNDYSGPGFITGGRKQISGWLYKSLMTNKTYDKMVKELISPVEGSEGFIKGIEWRGVVNASQRTEMQAAQNIGQSLMGVNVKCASCHNSFVSNLTLEQAYGFAAIFAEKPLELNRCDIPIGKIATADFLYPELGIVKGETIAKRLLNLSDIMVQEENGRLYRTITNRFWHRLLGKGIIEPLDEMDSPAWDDALMDWLASDFIAANMDLKHLIKRIMSSKTYQLPAVSYKKIEDTKTDYVFRGPLVRRLSAEQFSDAISQIISPLYPAVAFNPEGEKTKAKRVWHKEVSFNRTVLPEPGKRYFRKSFNIKNKKITNAKILISVDHAYSLFMNGKKIAEGRDWTQVDKLEVSNYLKPGKNTIAVEGENEGTIGNPAGVLFSMKVLYQSGETLEINSDETWKSTDLLPDENWTTNSFKDDSWKAVKNYGTQNWGTLPDFSFKNHDGKFARASLVKQHPFMKTLGRPSREIVTTSREVQATLLQALELTNGAFFNNVLEKGAIKWLEAYKNEPEKLVDQLYQKTLGRSPSPAEKNILMNTLGDAPQKEQLQDIFWSVFILPEFQFIN